MRNDDQLKYLYEILDRIDEDAARQKQPIIEQIARYNLIHDMPRYQIDDVTKQILKWE